MVGEKTFKVCAKISSFCLVIKVYFRVCYDTEFLIRTIMERYLSKDCNYDLWYPLVLGFKMKSAFFH